MKSAEMKSAESRSRKCTFSAVPLTANIGAEITGVDLSNELDEETFSAIRNAFYEYSVIVFRNQKITEEQQIRFSLRFGKLEKHVLSQYLHPRYPEIFIVSNIVENGRNIGAYDAGRYWHSDLSYKPAPSLASLLYAIEIPHHDSGQPLGDTCFASVTRAYDALPEAVKQRLVGLQALNSLEHRFKKLQADGDKNAIITEEQKKVSEAVHPVVRTHPVTGKKCIFVNEGQTDHILDLPEKEGEELLVLLCQQCIRKEFVYRHKWRVGDALMWDNCAAQHLAIADYQLPQRRLMHRTTLSGTVPF
jgi:taurine dioxygenase